jgi:hypothetical protein
VLQLQLQFLRRRRRVHAVECIPARRAKSFVHSDRSITYTLSSPMRFLGFYGGNMLNLNLPRARALEASQFQRDEQKHGVVLGSLERWCCSSFWRLLERSLGCHKLDANIHKAAKSAKFLLRTCSFENSFDIYGWMTEPTKCARKILMHGASFDGRSIRKYGRAQKPSLMYPTNISTKTSI